VKEFTQPRPTQLPGSPISPTVPVTRSLPILLVAYESEKAIKREVSTIEGQELAQQLNCEYAETSAKDLVNVEKAFYDVVRLLRIQQLEQRREESVARRKAWEARNTPRMDVTGYGPVRDEMRRYQPSQRSEIWRKKFWG